MTTTLKVNSLGDLADLDTTEGDSTKNFKLVVREVPDLDPSRVGSR